MTATSRGAKPSSLTLHLQGAAMSYFTLLVELTKSTYYCNQIQTAMRDKNVETLYKNDPFAS